MNQHVLVQLFSCERWYKRSNEEYFRYRFDTNLLIDDIMNNFYDIGCIAYMVINKCVSNQFMDRTWPFVYVFVCVNTISQKPPPSRFIYIYWHSHEDSQLAWSNLHRITANRNFPFSFRFHFSFLSRSHLSWVQVTANEHVIRIGEHDLSPWN